MPTLVAITVLALLFDFHITAVSLTHLYRVYRPSQKNAVHYRIVLDIQGGNKVGLTILADVETRSGLHPLHHGPDLDLLTSVDLAGLVPSAPTAPVDDAIALLFEAAVGTTVETIVRGDIAAREYQAPWRMGIAHSRIRGALFLAGADVAGVCCPVPALASQPRYFSSRVPRISKWYIPYQLKGRDLDGKKTCVWYNTGSAWWSLRRFGA